MNILIKVRNWLSEKLFDWASRVAITDVEEFLLAEISRLRKRLATAENFLNKVDLQKQEDSLTKRIRLKQKNCRHLKGGKTFNTTKDYAVSSFTFIDGRLEVKCLICRKIWTPDGPDWDKAVAMLDETSNKAASSERPFGPSVTVYLNKPNTNNTSDGLAFYEALEKQNPIRGIKHKNIEESTEAVNEG
jgi:hypothetical protein